MTDYKRVVSQNRANRIAVATMWVCVIAGVDEVTDAVRLHFPWWDDVAMVITSTVLMIAIFVERHTRQYRL